MSSLLIQNGHVVDPSQALEGNYDILIEQGKVTKIAKSIKTTKKVKKIDAKGLIVTPGWVDIHVHVREPGREDKETIKTCSHAAAMGGVTSICTMPNVGPIADNQTVIEYLVSRAKTESIVNLYPYGSITKGLKGEELTEIWDMKKQGMIGVSEDHRDVQNLGLFKKAVKYCKTFNVPIICHNENEDLTNCGVMHEGEVSTYLGLPGIPSSAEAASIAAQIVIGEEVGHPLHFTHVSAASSVAAIRDAKRRKISVTADCTPHHFTLTHESCLGYNTAAKVAPPLKTDEDKKAIIKGLKDGTIECIATDHAPHTDLDKYVDFMDAANGISGIETFVALVMDQLVHPGVLTLSHAIAKVTINPAKVVNLDKGSLAVGSDADVTVIDPKMERVVDCHDFCSKGKHTPFQGMNLKGWPVMTIVAGKIVMEDRKIKA